MDRKPIERKWLIAIPIILVLLLLCAGMVAISVVTAQRMTFNGVPMFAMGQVNATAEAEEQKTFTVNGAGNLVVDNPCGDVSVTAVEGSQVSVTAHKQAWGKDDEQAKQNLAKITPDLAQAGDTVRVGLPEALRNCQIERNVPFRVSYTIQAPTEMAVEVDTRAGNISLTGTQGAAQLASQFGDVTVQQHNGPLTINSQNGVLRAQDIQAGADSIRMKTAFGDIHLNNADAGSLRVESQNGKADLSDVVIAGAVELTGGFGDLRWQDGSGQSLTASSKNGRIDFQNLAFEEPLNVKTDFGDIRLANVQAPGYSATSKNGKITLEDVAGDVTAHSDFGAIDVNGTDAMHLNLSSENGAITAAGALAEGEHTIQTRFGDVHVRLPQEAGFNFDLQTRFGKISSDFPVTVQGTLNENHWTGTANGGGPSLTASTQNGNIAIEYNQ